MAIDPNQIVSAMTVKEKARVQKRLSGETKQKKVIVPINSNASGWLSSVTKGGITSVEQYKAKREKPSDADKMLLATVSSQLKAVCPAGQQGYILAKKNDITGQAGNAIYCRRAVDQTKKKKVVRQKCSKSAKDEITSASKKIDIGKKNSKGEAIVVPSNRCIASVVSAPLKSELYGVNKDGTPKRRTIKTSQLVLKEAIQRKASSEGLKIDTDRQGSLKFVEIKSPKGNNVNVKAIAYKAVPISEKQIENIKKFLDSDVVKVINKDGRVAVTLAIERLKATKDYDGMNAEEKKMAVKNVRQETLLKVMKASKVTPDISKMKGSLGVALSAKFGGDWKNVPTISATSLTNIKALGTEKKKSKEKPKSVTDIENKISGI